jgi:hypothetical protein
VILFDLETGDAARHFSSWTEGEKVLRQIAEEDPAGVRYLALFGYDKDGNIVARLPGARLLPATAS